MKKKASATLVGVKENLVDKVWKDRPERPTEKVIVLPEKYAGKSYKDKLTDLRKDITKKKAAGMVVSMLDEIAWLFNLRGSDIPYNPVFFSYAAVTANSATIYVDSAKLSSEVKEYLGDVKIKPYEALFSDLTAISEQAVGEAQANGDTEDKPHHEKL